METNELSRREFLEGVLASGGVMMAPEVVLQGHRPAASRHKPVSKMTVQLDINGMAHDLPDLDVNTTLLDCLRDHLHLTGSKKGCALGQCGACTVFVDDRRVNACLCLAVMQQGKKITTIEGIGQQDQLHPLQAAFISHDAFQCGYCTPGQIMSGVACIHEGHAGSDDEIREWMSGNICRCGAYPNIVAAVRRAAQRSV